MTGIPIMLGLQNPAYSFAIPEVRPPVLFYFKILNMYHSEEEKYLNKKTHELLQLANNKPVKKELAEAIIELLKKIIIFHEYKYYVENFPVIEDTDFDKLEQLLRNIEKTWPELLTSDSPTQRVGKDISTGFTQVRHRNMMLSLSNTYSKEELFEFDQRLKKLFGSPFSYVCELKFDGVAISITYQHGKFIHAITRGDGVQGDNVSNNVKTIRSIPLQLKGNDFPADFDIRGEIIMTRAGFNKLNKERKELGETEFANPRNSASGTLKILDPQLVAKRPLDCYFYYLTGNDLKIDSHYENLQQAKKWGFKISEHIRLCQSIDDVFEYLEYWEKNRKTLPFDTDGVVIKVDSLNMQKKAGFTAKSPRWATAFKFKTERVKTRLLSVSYQVGRTGAITPVANLEPVLLGGTTVKRASLHNADQIEILDLHLNDMVFVEKGGEIIPKIVGVNFENRDNKAEKIVFIDKCPECNSDLVRKDEEANHYCPNEDGCPPQIKGKILHFIGRKTMNIAFADATVDLLYEKGLVKNVADIYLLTEKDISQLERYGEKSAKNILTSINESRKVAFENVIFALGIRYVGETVAKTLARQFINIDNLANASVEQLKEAEEIGDRIAESVFSWFRKKENIAIISALKNAGLQFNYIQEEKIKSNKLEGKTFVVSGIFSVSRDDIKHLIEIHGGKNTGSVTGKTDYLLAGENMGPSKLATAEKLGVKILSEDEFYLMIN